MGTIKDDNDRPYILLTSLHLLVELRHVVRSDVLQELDVLITVESSHFLHGCLVRALKI